MYNRGYGHSTMSKIHRIQEDRFKKSQNILDDIYDRAATKIIDAEKEFKKNSCLFTIPYKMPDYDEYIDMDKRKVAEWLKRMLEQEGFIVNNLEGMYIDIKGYERYGTVHDIMIMWKQKEAKIFHSNIDMRGIDDE